jgi:DNA polymerase-3 subunit gamma/tau
MPAAKAPAPIVEREEYSAPQPVVAQEQILPTPVAAVEVEMPTPAVAPTQPAPAAEPQLRAEPAPKPEAFVVPVPQMNVEDALRSEPAPAPAQPLAQAPASTPDEESQSAWNSLSSILSSVAAKEGTTDVEPAPAPLAAPPAPVAARPAAAGLKLSLFSDDDDEEFTRAALAAAAPAAAQLGDQGQTQDLPQEEQDETAKRQSRLAAIRGLRGA